MKLRILTLYVLFVSGFTALQAQVVEEKKAMSLGVNNAMTIRLPGVEKAFAEKLWIRYMNTFEGQTKRMIRSDDWHTRNVIIPEIGGEKPLYLYAQLTNPDNEVALHLWTGLEDTFISRSQFPRESVEVEKLLIRFGLYVAKESSYSALEREETALKQLKANLKKLERDDERYRREAEQARKRIAEAESSLEKNANDQEQTRKLIQLQKQTIESVRKKIDGL